MGAGCWILAGLGLLRWEDRDTGPIIHPLLAEFAREQKMALGSPASRAAALVRLGTSNQELMAVQRPLHLEQPIGAFEAALEVFKQLPAGHSYTGIVERNLEELDR
jgi:hypothetical protein